MGSKSKIKMNDSIRNSELDAFDSMVDECLESEIGTPPNAADDSVLDESDGNTHCSNDIIEKNNDIFNKKDKICPFEDTSLQTYDDINKKLVDIYDEFVRDTKLTIANLSNVAQNEAFIKGRWCSKALAAKIHTKRLKSEYAELKTKITDMVASKMKNGAYLSKKASVDSVVGNDENLKTLHRRIEEAMLIEELYKSLYNDIIKGLGFQIRNSIDTLNFERGL